MSIVRCPSQTLSLGAKFVGAFSGIARSQERFVKGFYAVATNTAITRTCDSNCSHLEVLK
jgi:hypothetical protein